MNKTLQEYTNWQTGMQIILYKIEGKYKTAITDMNEHPHTMYTAFNRDYESELAIFISIVKENLY